MAAVDRSLCKDLRRVFEESCTNTWVRLLDVRVLSIAEHMIRTK